MKPLGKFGRRLGMEFTWVPKLMTLPGRRKGADIVGDISDGYATIVQAELDARGISYNACSTDPDCVEISSEPYDNWKQLKQFYTVVDATCKYYRLVPRTDTHSSGGGQIHVGDLTKLQIVAIMRDIANRPYLSWIFNDAEDDINAKSFVGDLCDVRPEDISRANKKGKVGYVDRINLHGATVGQRPRYRGSFLGEDIVSTNEVRGVMWYCKDMTVDGKVNQLKHGQLFYRLHKCHAVSYRDHYDTLEFRIFEAQRNVGEVEDHVRFTLAYVNWVIKRLAIGDTAVPVVTRKVHLKKFTRAVCIAEFKALLVALDLPYARYQKYVKRNLHLRWQYKTLK